MTCQGDLSEHLKLSVEQFGWSHPIYSEYNHDDTQLLVTGSWTAAGFRGEVGIYKTNRKSFDGRKSMPEIMHRVSNVPAYLTGSWPSSIKTEIFLSGTYDRIITNNFESLIWIRKAPNLPTADSNQDGHETISAKSLLFHFLFHDNAVSNYSFTSMM